MFDQLKHQRIHRIGLFLSLEENELRNANIQSQTPKLPPIHNVLVVQNKIVISSNKERVQKLEKELLNHNDDYFLFYLKIPLIDHIVSKVFTRKKSIKFTKFTGFQDPKMHVKFFSKRGYGICS